MALSQPYIGFFNDREPELSFLGPGPDPVAQPSELQASQQPGGLSVPFPYPDLIREHLVHGRIAAARNLFEFAKDLISPESGLVKALAPPKIKRSERRGANRVAEFRWLDANGVKYQRKWVALLGEELLGSADSLKELLGDLSVHPPAGKPLIHHLD